MQSNSNHLPSEHQTRTELLCHTATAHKQHTKTFTISKTNYWSFKTTLLFGPNLTKVKNWNPLFSNPVHPIKFTSRHNLAKEQNSVERRLSFVSFLFKTPRPSIDNIDRRILQHPSKTTTENYQSLNACLLRISVSLGKIFLAADRICLDGSSTGLPTGRADWKIATKIKMQINVFKVSKKGISSSNLLKLICRALARKSRKRTLNLRLGSKLARLTAASL